MKYTYLVLFILIFSALIRLVGLGSNPGILNRDEAAIGYNAFLLQQTGKDEWQTSWPLTLQSFGDYKLIGYPTLVAGLFAIFGYSDFIVRLPSAVAGVGVLYLIYQLIKRFTDDEKVAIFGLFLASVTPVLFFYSRVAFEANVGLLYFLSFLVLLLRPVDKKTVLFDCLAVICIVLGVVTYNTPLLLLPFVSILLPFWRGLKNVKQWLLIVSACLILFAGFVTIFSQLTAQKQAITIFSDPTAYHNFIQYRNQFSGLAQKFLGSKYVYYVLEIIPRFINSFSLKFLVTQGGAHPWHAVPGWGHLLLSQYLLAIGAGLYCLFSIVKKVLQMTTKKLGSHFYKPLHTSAVGKQITLVYLLIIGLAPSVITIDAPHATRSLFFIVMLIILASYITSQLQLTAKNIKILGFIFYIVTTTLFIKYLTDYFLRYPAKQPVILQTNYQGVLKNVEEKYPDQPIAVINPDGYQYILTAWYLKMPPQEFFNTVRMQNPDRIGFRYGQQVGRYHFIKEQADRSQQEKVSVEWSQESQSWQVQEGG